MELLRGEDLRARLRRMGRLPKEEAVHIVAQTLRGLHRAHAAGIVHRDLKPENIFLVDRDDDPLFAKIVDFGISKIARRPGEAHTSTLTRQGVVLGTPFYMSPEQAQAFADLDLRTDLWSVGAILYECLTGRPPHQGDAYEQIIVSICTKDVADVRESDPSLPSALAAFVKRALDRDRRRRFQSAKEMLDTLQSTGMLTPSMHGVSSEPGVQRTAFEAPSGPSAPAGTRVSWTTAHAETEQAPGTTEMRRRAGVRRRGLLLLGVTVTVGAFILTLALLRTRKESTSSSEKTSPTVSAAMGNPATDFRPAEPTPSAAVAPVPSEPMAAAPLISASARPTPGVPRASKKTGGQPAAAAAAPQATAAAATTTPKPAAGVAGGLQIKTTYP
jgi:serine/threonine-protein kinase